MHDIQKRVIETRNKELDQKSLDIDKAIGGAQMFKAVKDLNRKPFENPKVFDANKKFIASPNGIAKVIGNHFENKFYDGSKRNIDSFEGNPRPLNKEISEEEVTKSLKRLNNSRATGTLIALPKPGKEKGPTKNLRPVILLNTIRKCLSLITLDRITSKVDAFLPQSQSGFRKGRSTSDIVFTHRWLIAKAQKEKTNIYITVKVAKEQPIFQTNIGTPQGDSLSPVLFTVYLESALRGIRTIIQTEIPQEISYADDVDFLSLNSKHNVNKLERHLSTFNLNVNKEKTEHTIVRREKEDIQEQWRNTKKVGSLLGDRQDIIRRKQLARVAMTKLNSMWLRKDKIKLKIRIKLYNSLVKSILLYNSETWGLTKEEAHKLDTFHRQQLRKIIGIRFPDRISNINLYRRTGTKPISLEIVDARWRLLGHILRQDPCTPANTAISYYFSNTTNIKFRGRPRTTLPITLSNDLLILYKHNTDIK
ncbi:uncharacterized protein [Antedon mediterranea]|uniref:uncharacterized protein n=1 Tax=Antedon mediterranea TaxID=105859 RepID=UPI003AF69FBE